MVLNRFQKIVLGLAGVTAACIGGFILTAPQAFYAGYGITLGADPTLLSEIRAPAACLFGLGLLMLAGLVRPTWTHPAIAAAFVVFLAFPAGRVVGLIVDGVPAGGILAALAVELVIAALLFAAFGRRGAISVPAPRQANAAG
ncbi:DUF4345 domain-containing protein [Oricola sp.]|uniref:DUF4345 domain-containing protein n=1 Tax=Oricola sp. TaxID=1979950 RepID=UPI0025EA38BF|nr:DUF4345 domain-containing protein [Oricola sp.]MCI5074391.1 DUF4345 domain-containing protein [Oricola sp.]